MKSLFSFIIIAVFCITSIVNAQKTNQVKYKVFYIPLDVEYYMPTMITNVEERAYYIFEMTSRNIDKIINEDSLQKVMFMKIDPQKYYDVVVKIIDSNNHVYYVNKKKELFINNLQYSLNKKLINSFINELAEKTKKLKSRF